MMKFRTNGDVSPGVAAACRSCYLGTPQVSSVTYRLGVFDNRNRKGCAGSPILASTSHGNKSGNSSIKPHHDAGVFQRQAFYGRYSKHYVELWMQAKRSDAGEFFVSCTVMKRAIFIFIFYFGPCYEQKLKPCDGPSFKWCQMVFFYAWRLH